MINFKEALKEIFVDEMGSGKELENICDGILLSIMQPVGDSFNNFITLGGFSASDVRVGHLKKKFREVELEIECNAVFRKRSGESNPEAVTESNSQAIAKKVRTILKANQTLVSTSYSGGVAIHSEVINEVLDWVQYGNVQCASSIVTLYMKILEAS